YGSTPALPNAWAAACSVCPSTSGTVAVFGCGGAAGAVVVGAVVLARLVVVAVVALAVVALAVVVAAVVGGGPACVRAAGAAGGASAPAEHVARAGAAALRRGERLRLVQPGGRG